MKYFSYDPNGNGFRLHNTEEEAKSAANNALESERDVAADDGWNEEVEDICWGKIIQSIVKIKDSGSDGVDYKLVTP